MPGRALRKSGWLLSLTLLLASALAIGGCGKKITAEEIVANVQEIVANANGVHAVIELAANVQGESVQMVVEAWGKRPNKAHVEVLEADRDEFVGIEAVTDGQTVWLFTPEENQVFIANVIEIPGGPMLGRIIEDIDGFFQRVLDASDVELLGEEEIAGQETHKLSLTPKEDEAWPLPVSGTAVLWVDKKEWVVLKAHLVVPNLAEGTVQVRSYELSPRLDDEVFTFRVPQGVEIASFEDTSTQHMTMDEAEAQAGFDLLTPAYLPDRATLVDVMKVQDAYVLVYALPSGSLTVAQSVGELPPEPSEPMVRGTVDVRGHQATLLTAERFDASYLSWQQGGINFAITGRIGGDEAVKIAESLE